MEKYFREWFLQGLYQEETISRTPGVASREQQDGAVTSVEAAADYEKLALPLARPSERRRPYQPVVPPPSAGSF
ncbi:unnamed protein product [Boreogadus saida]